MQPAMFKRNVGQIYLSLVPILTTIFAFVTGHISYKIYLPIWIINVCLMIIAAWILGAHVIRNHDHEKKHLAVIGCFLITPGLLVSIFFGMGAPPETPAEWVATATEQQVRFSILIICATLIGFGLGLLREKLKTTGENFYSQLGFTAIMMAIPLFVIVTTFWHSFALESYRIQMASASEKIPEWYLPIRKQVWVISMVEVVLIYLATAAFAASLKSAGWFRKTPSRIYIVISLFAIIIILLYPIYPVSVTSAGFPYIPFMIPGVTFFMLYFIGINLLRRAGN